MLPAGLVTLALVALAGIYVVVRKRRDGAPSDAEAVGDAKEGKVLGVPEEGSSRAAEEGGNLQASSKVTETWHRPPTCVQESTGKASEAWSVPNLLSVALDVADACAGYYTGGSHRHLRAFCETVMREVMDSQRQRQPSPYCPKCEKVEQQQQQQREEITRLRAEIGELLRQNHELMNAKRELSASRDGIGKWARPAWGGITKWARLAWDSACACIGYILPGG